MTSRDIGVLRELVKKKKLAKELSLNDKLSKQHGLATLQEMYKPMLESQETQKKELKKQTEKQEEQLVKQQQTIEEIRRSQTFTTEELRKQQLVVPLIKSLAKHKNIISVLKGEDDGSTLDETEKNILKELSFIDEKTLLTLINHFSDSGKEKDDIFGTPSGTETPKQEPPGYSRIPGNIKTSVALGEWILKDLLDKRSHSVDRNKAMIKQLLTQGLPADNRSPDDIKKALVDYVENLRAFNVRADLGHYPWSTVKTVDPDFFKSIQSAQTPPKKPRKTTLQSSSTSSTPKGTGSTTFLTSDPAKLVQRLDILYAEKQAGNNNVLSEATAIADELRRQGLITTETLKTLSKKFAN